MLFYLCFLSRFVAYLRQLSSKNPLKFAFIKKKQYLCADYPLPAIRVFREHPRPCLL